MTQDTVFSLFVPLAMRQKILLNKPSNYLIVLRVTTTFSQNTSINIVSQFTSIQYSREYYKVVYVGKTIKRYLKITNYIFKEQPINQLYVSRSGV